MNPFPSNDTVNFPIPLEILGKILYRLDKKSIVNFERCSKYTSLVVNRICYQQWNIEENFIPHNLFENKKIYWWELGKEGDLDLETGDVKLNFLLTCTLKKFCKDVSSILTTARPYIIEKEYNQLCTAYQKQYRCCSFLFESLSMNGPIDLNLFDYLKNKNVDIVQGIREAIAGNIFDLYSHESILATSQSAKYFKNSMEKGALWSCLLALKILGYSKEHVKDLALFAAQKFYYKPLEKLISSSPEEDWSQEYLYPPILIYLGNTNLKNQNFILADTFFTQAFVSYEEKISKSSLANAAIAKYKVYQITEDEIQKIQLLKDGDQLFSQAISQSDKKLKNELLIEAMKIKFLLLNIFINCEDFLELTLSVYDIHASVKRDIFNSHSRILYGNEKKLNIELLTWIDKFYLRILDEKKETLPLLINLADVKSILSSLHTFPLRSTFLEDSYKLYIRVFKAMDDKKLEIPAALLAEAARLRLKFLDDNLVKASKFHFSILNDALDLYMKALNHCKDEGYLKIITEASFVNRELYNLERNDEYLYCIDKLYTEAFGKYKISELTFILPDAASVKYKLYKITKNFSQKIAYLKESDSLYDAYLEELGCISIELWESALDVKCELYHLCVDEAKKKSLFETCKKYEDIIEQNKRALEVFVDDVDDIYRIANSVAKPTNFVHTTSCNIADENYEDLIYNGKSMSKLKHTNKVKEIFLHRKNKCNIM